MKYAFGKWMPNAIIFLNFQIFDTRFEFFGELTSPKRWNILKIPVLGETMLVFGLTKMGVR